MTLDRTKQNRVQKAEASAPANIALIKYMGKIDPVANRPTNASLSWTLMDLRSFVRLTEISDDKDRWAPLEGGPYQRMEWTQAGQEKYLKHFRFLKQELGVEGHFLIESGNNFPADCGLASSASSFAALTLATHEMSCQSGEAPKDFSFLANLSRHGSGSSIRSFYVPWALWQSDTVRPLEFPVGKLTHLAVTIDSGKKAVSSSEAHKRVVTSSLFHGRAQRAEQRLAHLMTALRSQQWREAFDICWSEFWDMHALFETSQPPFGYMLPGSLAALREIQKIWEKRGDGPIVTMDAGPNLHLLFRENQHDLHQELKAHFAKQWSVF